MKIIYILLQRPQAFPPLQSQALRKVLSPFKIFQARNEVNKALNKSNLSEEKQENPDLDNGKGKQKSLPDSGSVLAAAEVLVSYAMLRKRKSIEGKGNNLRKRK